MNVVIITGSRDWGDEDSLIRVLENACPHLVVEGGCPRGADAIAREWAKRYGVRNTTYRANWAKHGRAAGPLRNGLMLRSHPDAHVLAFPLGGGGTEDCIRQARALGMHVSVYDVMGILVRANDSHPSR